MHTAKSGGTSPDAPWTAEVRREVLDASMEVSYVLDSELRIVCSNPAWNRFALANGGEACIGSNVKGASILDATCGELQDFYTNVFHASLSEKRVIEFDYECSSSSIYRLLRMHLFPFKQWDGVLVVNSPRIERPHEGRAEVEDPSDYIGKNGIASVCAQCRRAKDATGSRWDWVPSLLNGSVRLSHGICPVCREYLWRLDLKLMTPSIDLS